MSFDNELTSEHERVARLVRHASIGWAEAMRAHKLAPPDDGFSGRLRQLSEAAAAEQLAWQQAHAARMLWHPITDAEHAEPPYELRPGSGRRGPEDLWLHFDNAVTELNRAIGGSSAKQVASAFGEMAKAAAALAGAVAQEDEMKLAAREFARARPAA